VAAVSTTQGAPHDAASGVLLASNKAAGAPGSAAAKRADERSTAVSSPILAAVRPAPGLDPREALHLIWYQPESVARICHVPVWRAIVDDMEKKPADADLDDPAPTRDPVEIEDQRDIFEILVRGASQDIDQLGDELVAAVRPGGKFVPSLLLLAGELSFPFDERETLKAVVAVATPMANTDEGLKGALREAREFLATPDLVCPAPITEGYTARIREAFGRGRRSVTPETFESHVERALLEGRHYQRRKVLGMNAIRAQMLTSSATGARPAPVYMADEIARKLPLFQRFRARLIAELYPQEDQYEPHPAALKALALGRVMPTPERR